ncbi:ABC transporter ATP-binding protein [Xenophilus sp. Marseille-Q4582]|uniref:ABC transporter ATP-binding protein n=1 Tax=Xenophilus sp. Marseille-Q4582 TaxID=2866600 RepID=UPI001CE41A7C|nr:ABC transporter ATP-binding protein [Xenophilus sp. Marseille-Q4582]
MFEVRGLAVRYGRHQALQDISLDVRCGEIVVVLGANGAGKSSLLRSLAGLTPYSGHIVLQGQALHAMAPHQVVEAGLAIVPEGRGVFGSLSVAENLRLGALPRRARQSEAQTLATVLGLFPRLAERQRQLVGTMSGGEQQMVAIGRAMMSAPSLLLLDEPGLGLSPLMCQELFVAIRKVRDLGIAVMLVEQNARQALAIADRGYLLAAGQVVGEGPAASLRADAAVQKAFLGA